MSLLHDYFNARNFQLFQKLLLESCGPDRTQSGALSTSAGKSKKLGLLANSNVDVNARDWLGRTVLHLACVSFECLEYVRVLLKHPGVNANLPDAESNWTPLHRALYHANFPAARLLLQRPDVDIGAKDNEGYTAFDLYNSTINGTKPSLEDKDVPAELYTWGANVNATLGLGDSNDRASPEQVILQHKEEEEDLRHQPLTKRFLPILVKKIEMSRLHTAVLTEESGGNLLVCGFGSGGRLGPNSHAQYTLKSLPQLSQKIVAIALGQDHTLALTSNGEVLSWGLNRFVQLGYPLEVMSGRAEEPIQYSPRKIQGPLRKETVIGVAASKCASACWTDESVFTWGTNNGQLGYDKIAQPVQIQPRKVSRLTSPVIAVTMTENVMACLTQSRQVECFYNDGHHRISFPTQTFPSPMRPYRPPQAVKDSRMAKITSCGDVFASLSHLGEVFIFSPSGGSDSEGSARAGPFKCQRVWALRKKFSAVTDVALGADGSIIICTESGHVFVRTRNVKAGQSSKAFKFQRVSALQRVTRVAANASGAFAALRVDFKPKPIEVGGNMLWQDLARIQPYLVVYKEDSDPRFAWMRNDVGNDYNHTTARDFQTSVKYGHDSDVEEQEMEDSTIEHDIRTLTSIIDAIKREEASRDSGKKLDEIVLPHGADLLIRLQSGAVFPVHTIILAARSTVLCQLFLATTKKSSSIQDSEQKIRIGLLPTIRRSGYGHGPGSSSLLQLSFVGCHPVAVLVLLNYFYSDNLIAVWDRRVSIAIGNYAKSSKVKFDVSRIKIDLQILARMLELPQIVSVLERPVKHDPKPTMVKDMENLFNTIEHSFPNLPLPCTPDVVLELRDKNVYTYSAILRCRSEFFASLFNEPVWTQKRWENGVLTINMRHLSWRAMEYVLRFVCYGADAELFEALEFVNSVDDLLEFMFDVLGAANELLLDRLVLLCSNVILTHMDTHNACYILADATYYSANQLIERVESYITANAELFLECHMLDDLTSDLLLQLATFVKEKQEQKTPFVRRGIFMTECMEKHKAWLEVQDVPTPFVRSNKPWQMKTSAIPIPKFDKTSATGESKGLRYTPSDDIFVMDGIESSLLFSDTQPQKVGSVWRASLAPKVDMKTVMAEAAASHVRQIQPKVAPPIPSEATKLPSKPQRTAVSVSPEGIIPQAPSQTTTSPRKAHTVSLPEPSVSQPSTPSKRGEAQLSGNLPPQHRQDGQTHTVPRTPPRSTIVRQPSVVSLGTTMGPTITPTKISASSSKIGTGSRTGSGSGKAWSNRPNELATPIHTPSKAGMSFVAIQHSQQAQALDTPRDKRSLLEIQEEEKARRAEEEFLKWWEEEEARVKEEMDTLARLQALTEDRGESTGHTGGRGGVRRKREGRGQESGERSRTEGERRNKGRKGSQRGTTERSVSNVQDAQDDHSQSHIGTNTHQATSNHRDFPQFKGHKRNQKQKEG